MMVFVEQGRGSGAPKGELRERERESDGNRRESGGGGGGGGSGDANRPLGVLSQLFHHLSPASSDVNRVTPGEHGVELACQDRKAQEERASRRLESQRERGMMRSHSVTAPHLPPPPQGHSGTARPRAVLRAQREGPPEQRARSLKRGRGDVPIEVRGESTRVSFFFFVV